jgi:hypothetical protein
MGSTKWTQVYTMPAERGAVSRAIQNGSSSRTSGEEVQSGVESIQAILVGTPQGSILPAGKGCFVNAPAAFGAR